MKHCSGKTDDALHGTRLLVFRMPGCQAGCQPGKDPAKQGPFQQLYPCISIASATPPALSWFCCSGETGKGWSDSRRFWGLWVKLRTVACFSGGLEHIALAEPLLSSLLPQPPTSKSVFMLSFMCPVTDRSHFIH